ncbi:MAG: DegT/DnrJ/EryC1/StrS family aminotransferase [Desulfobacterales bacterium]|nr:DegT/DnrJ/EryC1/StrS family aminotransferase [Desulfobacterales bacterium]
MTNDYAIQSNPDGVILFSEFNPGTNAKMNEFQALMGEMVLAHIDQIINKREKLYRRYSEILKDVPGISLVPPLPASVEYNYAYMPIEVGIF